MSWETRDYINSIWGIKINNKFIILNKNTDKVEVWIDLWNASSNGYWKMEDIGNIKANKMLKIIIQEIFND